MFSLFKKKQPMKKNRKTPNKDRGKLKQNKGKIENKNKPPRKAPPNAKPPRKAPPKDMGGRSDGELKKKMSLEDKALIGGLKKQENHKKKRQSELLEEIQKENEGRVSINPERYMDENGTVMSKQEIDKRKARAQKEEVERRQKASELTWVRREIDGFAPLNRLDIINKLKVAWTYREEKSGNTEKKNSERQNKINMKNMQVEAKIRKNITKYTEVMMNGPTKEQLISVEVPTGYIKVLKNVLEGDYFRAFDIELLPVNKNLGIYGINPPVLVLIKKKEGVGRAQR